MSQQFPPSDQPPNYQQPQQPYPLPPSNPQLAQQVYGDQRNQQPLPRKPKRGFFRSPLGIGCGVLVAVIILIIVIVAIATAANGGKGTASTPPSNTTGNTPASGTTSHSIGQAVVAGTWTATVNKTSVSHGSQFDTPKAGDVFLVVNVTLKNTDTSAQTASSLVMFALKDSTGQTYQEDITAGGTPDGDVAPGGLVRGSVSFDVPKSVHTFTLQFTPGLDASQLVEWQIKD